MSIAELSALSDDELRVKVAKACGWTNIVQRDGLASLGCDPVGLYDRVLYDYPNDLNACASFERTMSDARFLIYCHYLSNGSASFRVAIEAVAMSIQVLRRNFVSASPRQRCIAFLASQP